jgi:hypothetical protein
MDKGIEDMTIASRAPRYQERSARTWSRSSNPRSTVPSTLSALRYTSNRLWRVRAARSLPPSINPRRPQLSIVEATDAEEDYQSLSVAYAAATSHLGDIQPRTSCRAREEHLIKRSAHPLLPSPAAHCRQAFRWLCICIPLVACLSCCADQ